MVSTYLTARAAIPATKAKVLLNSMVGSCVLSVCVEGGRVGMELGTQHRKEDPGSRSPMHPLWRFESKRQVGGLRDYACILQRRKTGRQ